MVDYICVPHDILSQFQGINYPIYCRYVSDHDYPTIRRYWRSLALRSTGIADRICRLIRRSAAHDLKLNNIPRDFMDRDISRIALNNIVSRCRETQTDIWPKYTITYNKLFFSEMKKSQNLVIRIEQTTKKQQTVLERSFD